VAKKVATVFSTSMGNPWHGVKIDTRRKLNLKNKVKKK
tara:strand:+ start:1750 stop:1863 length:114 start_codon:yes stop_codon:yes gene_type:complete